MNTTTPNDGGPAFPVPRQNFGHGVTLECEHMGLTLRDWFAGQALGDVITCCQRGFIAASGPKAIAQTAYEIADAMLAARNNTNTTAQ